MKTTRRKPSARSQTCGARGVDPVRSAHARELATLRLRLGEANEALQAIGRGEVDAVVVAGRKGRQVFTLQGAEHAYRVLIESMNEGALTLTADQAILYANAHFARMVKCPLERVIGSTLPRFLSADDQALLNPLMKQAGPAGSKLQVMLRRGDGGLIPVQISLRPLARGGASGATMGLVVTDMTEARRNEERLRALTNRVVQTQEAERGRVALELHDDITQLLCAIVFRSQTLMDKLSKHDGGLKAEAKELHAMLGEAATEVERISRNLRPSVLHQLGLVSVIRETTREFTARTGVPVTLDCAALSAALPVDTDLALYRILQEALKNVEKHAHASRVTVSLGRHEDTVRLAIDDDGIGFEPDLRPGLRAGTAGLGLFGMRERAKHVSGMLTIRSGRHAGTGIEVRIPVGPVNLAAA